MKVYLAQVALAALLFLLCVGAFNWWSDPFTIWRPADVERRNLGELFLRMSKPWQISRIKPSAAIIGSSRSGSINSQHAVWAGETTYNLSLHGISVYETKRFIEHSQAYGALEKLLIAIEFDTFIASRRRQTGVGYVEARMLNSQEDGRRWAELMQRVRDIRDTLFSTSALTYSLRAQFPKSPARSTMQADGSWRLSTTGSGKDAFIGAGQLLLKRSRKFSRDTIDKNLAIFADILAFCHRHKIDARLYLGPEHLFMTDFRRHIGYADERDDFLRQVIALNEEVGASTGSPPFPVWGFNHMGDIVDHPLREGYGNRADWFRDGFHYYSKLGDIIMEQVWGVESTAGMRIDADSIDTYIAEVEKLRGQFVLEQEEQILDYRREILGDTPD